MFVHVLNAGEPWMKHLFQKVPRYFCRYRSWKTWGDDPRPGSRGEPWCHATKTSQGGLAAQHGIAWLGGSKSQQYFLGTFSQHHFFVTKFNFLVLEGSGWWRTPLNTDRPYRTFLSEEKTTDKSFLVFKAWGGRGHRTPTLGTNTTSSSKEMFDGHSPSHFVLVLNVL